MLNKIVGPILLTKLGLNELMTTKIGLNININT